MPSQSLPSLLRGCGVREGNTVGLELGEAITEVGGHDQVDAGRFRAKRENLKYFQDFDLRAKARNWP
jgi:hypothetical protein